MSLLLLVGSGCHQKPVNPAGCQLTTILDNETYTYQFDLSGQLTHISRHTASHDVDYAYTYQGKQAMIDITYPRSGANGLRFRYELTLNEQGYLLTAQETMYTTLANGTVNESLINRHNCTYDDQGYLITHHVDRYTYPSGGSQQLSQTTQAQLSYQDGNPVGITYLDTEGNQTQSASLTTNRYGTQPNPVKLPFLLEANPFGYSPDRALQPLLGKPPRTLITSSALSGPLPMTTQYTYRTDASGQLVQVGRASSPVLSAFFSLSFETTCP